MFDGIVLRTPLIEENLAAEAGKFSSITHESMTAREPITLWRNEDDNRKTFR